MAEKASPTRPSIAAWQPNLLALAASFSVLLIAMGGVLCVTGSIRSCPDWPGCFGKALPPLETSPILEITHRLLAAITGLLILSAAIAGLWRRPRSGWLQVLPWIAILLVVEVSMFGALVVLRGIPRGWVAVDLGSALLVVALLVMAASLASNLKKDPAQLIHFRFTNPFAGLVLAAGIVVYLVLVSGVLVAGNNPLTGCLGWPIYSSQLFQQDLPGAGKILRLVLSVVAIGLLLAVLVGAWLNRERRPAAYRAARWTAAAFLLEAALQVLLLVFGFQVTLLVPYTVTASVFWALLVKLVILAGLEDRPAS